MIVAIRFLQGTLGWRLQGFSNCDPFATMNSMEDHRQTEYGDSSSEEFRFSPVGPECPFDESIHNGTIIHDHDGYD